MPFKNFTIILLAALNFIAQKSSAQSCPFNIDFEKGNYSRWMFYTGSCCPISTPVAGQINGRHELTNGTAFDPYGPTLRVVSPSGGNFSLKLGNDGVAARAERARYYVKVPNISSTYVLVFQYAVVFEDPGHSASQQPRFEVSAYDSTTGELIPCSDATYVATASLPGFNLSPVKGPSGADVWWKDWASASIFLGQEVAGKTVAIDFATGDCAQGGHFGYAYIDMDCGLFKTDYNIACKPGSTVQLDAPPGYSKYEWWDEKFTKSISTSKTTLVGVPDSTTSFAVVLTPLTGFGCTDTLYARIANLRVDATMDSILCVDAGTVATIPLSCNVKGDATPFTYNWYPTTGLSCSNCPNPVATVDKTIKYYVTVTDSNNCSKTDSTLLTVAEKVEAKISKPADTVCQFDYLPVASIGDNPADAQHLWSPGEFGSIISGDGTDSAIVNWKEAGLQKLKLRVSNGYCDRYDSVEVFVKPAPTASYEVKFNVCLNELVKLYPKETPDALYYWNIEDHSISDTLYTSAIDLAWSSLGRKSVRLSVKAENGCIDHYDSAVRVHEYPKGKIMLDNMDICNGDTVKLYTEPGAYYTYQWTPASMFTGNNTPEVKAVATNGTYISLNVRTQWGCNTSDSIYLNTEKCCKLILPDAFAPAGSGRNAKFRIISQGTYQVHTFMIVNRAGKILHNAQDNSGWDGTFNGELQPMGTYHYYIKYICGSTGKIEETKGNFILLK